VRLSLTQKRGNLFTGIIEELGTVERIEKYSGLIRLAIKADVVCRDVQIGDSLAVNGVCLTIVGIDKGNLSFDVIKQTADTTNLGRLKKGDRVNLERSLRANSPLGGHFVTGHIDCIGKIIRIKKLQGSASLTVRVADWLSVFLIPKGSVAVDGISLTIADIGSDTFTVNVIPHTLKATTLGLRSCGDKVNIEVDVLAKLLHKTISGNKDKKIKNLLRNHGFLE
jgi:riboflavin synthase